MWKQEIRYLRVFVVSAKTFKINVQNARYKYFRALNGIFSKVGLNASPAVLLSLIESCVSILTFACESILLNKSTLTCWNLLMHKPNNFMKISVTDSNRLSTN